MSSDDKQKRSDALKNLEAARRGEKKRMDQYEEYDEEFDEDYDEQAVEEYLQERRSSMCGSCFIDFVVVVVVVHYSYSSFEFRKEKKESCAGFS